MRTKSTVPPECSLFPVVFLISVFLFCFPGCKSSNSREPSAPSTVNKKPTNNPAETVNLKHSQPAPLLVSTQKQTDPALEGTVFYTDDTPVLSGTVTFRKNNAVLQTAPLLDGKFIIPLPSLKTEGYIEITANHQTSPAVFQHDTQPNFLNYRLSSDGNTMYRIFKIAKSSSVAGRVTGPNDAPVSNATVIFRSVKDAQHYYPDAVTTTSANGDFAYGNLPQTIGMLRVLSADHIPYIDYNFTPITAPVTIKLTNQKTSITGTAKMFGSDLPVPNKTVTFFDDFAAKGKLINTTFGNITSQTDEYGIFTFQNLPISSAYISLSSASPRLENFPPALEQARVNLADRPQSNATVIVYHGYNVSGRVYETETNAPIANAEIQFGSDRITTSSADGTYKIDGLFNDSQITVKHDKFIIPYSTDYKVELKNLQSPDVEMNFGLKKAVRISGKVTNENGIPLSTAQVWVPVQNNFFIAPNPIPVNSQGEFTVQSESRKKAVVAAKASGYAPAASEMINILDSDTTGIHIRLQPGATISGTVTNSDGEPAANIPVRQSLYDHLYMSNSTLTNQQGQFRFTDVPARSFYKAGNDNNPTESQAVNASPGQLVNDLSFRLDSTTHTISGMVINKENQPIPNATVTALLSLPFDSIYVETHSAVDGTFKIQNTVLGAYTLYAEKDKKHSEHVTQNNPDENIVLTLDPSDNRESSKTIILQASDSGTTLTDFNVSTEKNIRFERDQNTVIFYGEPSEYFKVNISAQGYLSLAQTIHLDNKGSQTLILDPEGLSVSGTVIDAETKAPLPGIKVFTGRKPDKYSTFDFTGSGAITDTNGKYQITNLTKQSNRIYIVPPDPYVADDKPIPPDKNQKETVNFELEQGVNLKGRVTFGANNTPVPHYNIMFEKTEGHRRYTTSADVNGEFTLKNIPSGTYNATVSDSSAVPIHNDLPGELKDAIPYRTTVTVNKDSNDLCQIHIRIKELKLHVTINEKPISQNEYSIILSSEKHNNVGRYDISDEMITYRSLLPGSYMFKIENKPESGRNTTTFLREQIDVGDELLQEERFAISTGKISGKVFSADNIPVSNCYMKIFKGAPTNTPVEPLQLYTNKNGYFETTELTSGNYTVTASHSQFGIGKMTDINVASGTKEITIPLSSHFGSLESLAIDSVTGDPLPDAYLYMITADGIDFNIIPKRDAYGVLEVLKVPAGIYDVTVGQNFYTRGKHRIEIKPDKKTTIEDALTPGGNFEWQFTSAQYSRREGTFPPVSVTVTPLDSESLQEAVTQNTVRWGLCHFSGLLPGEYQAVASYEGKTLAEIGFNVKPNETTIEMSDLSF